MTVLLKLIKPIQSLDKYINRTNIKIRSWIFLKFGGYKCTLCGSKHLHFKHQEAIGWVNHVSDTTSRMLLSWSMNDHIVCPLCAIDEIHNHFIEHYYFPKNGVDNLDDIVKLGTCDYTGKTNVPVCNIIFGLGTGGFNLRHGKEWWNGFNASEEALESAIRTCVIQLSIITYDTDKPLYASGKYQVPSQTFIEWKRKQDWYL